MPMRDPLTPGEERAMDVERAIDLWRRRLPFGPEPTGPELAHLVNKLRYERRRQQVLDATLALRFRRREAMAAARQQALATGRKTRAILPTQPPARVCPNSLRYTPWADPGEIVVCDYCQQRVQIVGSKRSRRLLRFPLHLLPGKPAGSGA